MPAAAVIPAPIAYIKVVAVKTLVVRFLKAVFLDFPVWEARCCLHPSVNYSRHSFVGLGLRYFTLRKLECFRQAFA